MTTPAAKAAVEKLIENLLTHEGLGVKWTKMSDSAQEQLKAAWVEIVTEEVVFNGLWREFMGPDKPYQWQNYTMPGKDHCGLCGNHGVIKSHVHTPAGLHIDIKRFCICPNGRALLKVNGGQTE